MSCGCLGHEVLDGKVYGRYYMIGLGQKKGYWYYRDCPKPNSNFFDELINKYNKRVTRAQRNKEDRIVDSVPADWYEKYKQKWKTPRDWNDGRGIMTPKERHHIWFGKNNWSNCKKCIKYSICHFYCRDDGHLCPYYDKGDNNE